MRVFQFIRSVSGVTIQWPGGLFSLCRPVLPVVLLSLVSIIGISLTSCAPSDELRDDEMEQLLDKAVEEYEDLAEILDEMAVHGTELDDETLKEMDERAEELLEELPELAVNLRSHRSRLSDIHNATQNEIPGIYLQKEEPEQQRTQNRGFRIQIISTQDARHADEIREDFEEWIRDVTAPPYPASYMIFQQPYYRVQVGDFLQRENAMEFTDFVRLRYPDAWVVHSRIRPGNVIN